MRFLFVDRILNSEPARFVSGLKNVTADDFYLTQDAEGRDYFVSSLMGETIGQLAAWNVMAHVDFSKRPVAGVVGCATVLRPAYVGETLFLEAFIDRVDETLIEYHGRATISGQEVFKLEGALGPMLPMETFIDKAVALEQYNEIYRPGEWLPIDNQINMAKNRITALNKGPRVAQMVYDSLLEFIPGESLTAIKYVTRAAPYFPDHFPGKPVLPLTVLLESNLNLAQTFAQQSGWFNYKIHQVRRVKMNDFISPSDTIVTHLKIKKKDEQGLVLSYRTEVNGRRVCLSEVVLLES